jgi:hypothetical protein
MVSVECRISVWVMFRVMLRSLCRARAMSKSRDN